MRDWEKTQQREYKYSYPVMFYVDEEMDDLIRRAAYLRRETRSKIIRRAVKNELDRLNINNEKPTT